jgi:hypothetical protein
MAIRIRQLGQIARAYDLLSQRLFQPPPNTISTNETYHWPAAGQPVAPIGPKDSQPLGMPFWFGQNQMYTPRPDAMYTFRDLQHLSMYPLARICIENVKDQLCQLKWYIRLRQMPGETRKDVKERRRREQNGDPWVAKLSDIFSRPNSEQTWPEWLRPTLDDMLVCDAASVYLRKNRLNQLAELRWIPGQTIVRYIDDNGYTPLPPDPAYAQLWEGIPRNNLTQDQLFYRPRNIVPRETISSFLYGCSPCEQVADEIKVGAARLQFVMRFYDKGSLPNFLHVVPPGTPPDTIREAMNYVNSELSGNLAERREYRIVQGFNRDGREDQFIFPKDPVLADVWDDVHIRKLCFAFGTSPQRLQRMMNRGSATVSQTAAEEEGIRPWKNWIKDCLVDPLIWRMTGSTKYEMILEISHETDEAKDAKIHTAYVHEGIETRNQAKDAMDMDPDPSPFADMLTVTTPQGAVPLGQTAMGMSGPKLVEKGDPTPSQKVNGHSVGGLV